MFAAVRAGGLVVLHVLNLWRLPDGPCVWQKCRRAPLEDQVDCKALEGVAIEALQLAAHSRQSHLGSGQ